MEEEVKELENVSFRGKDKTKLPEGATVIKKDVRVEVQEIENGFIVKKTFDIKYSLNGSNDYLYYCKKVYSKTNPVQIKEDKMLADYFD